jgi:hypothetical protein
MKYILCLDKLGHSDEDQDISLFVETFKRKDGSVEIECYDTKESMVITLDLFQFMVRQRILLEY